MRDAASNSPTPIPNPKYCQGDGADLPERVGRRSDIRITKLQQVTSNLNSEHNNSISSGSGMTRLTEWPFRQAMIESFEADVRNSFKFQIESGVLQVGVGMVRVRSKGYGQGKG